MDLQFDDTADGRRLKSLNMIDEHSLLCLAIRVVGAPQSSPWRLCSRSWPVSTQSRHSLGQATVQTSSPNPYGTGVRPAGDSVVWHGPDPHRQVASPSYSMAGAEMSSSYTVDHHGPRRAYPGRTLSMGVQLPQAALGPPGASAPGVAHC